MEDVSIFCALLIYFMVTWYRLCPFGPVCGHLAYFPPFWYFVPRKIWQPWPHPLVPGSGLCSRHLPADEPLTFKQPIPVLLTLKLTRTTSQVLWVRDIEILVIHRTCMFALVQQTFLAKKIVKSMLVSTLPRQGDLLPRNIFTGLHKTSPYNTK
jgi:hypothetical protein